MSDPIRITRARAEADAHPIADGEPFRLTYVHHGPHSSTVIGNVRAGGGIRPHIHRDHDEIIVMLEGEADFRVGERTERVRAGDIVSVPAGTVHAPTRSDAGCLLMTVFAPTFNPERPDRHFVDG